MDVPHCTRYDIALTIQPERVPSVFKLYGGSIAVDCTAAIENHPAQALGAVPFLLYRLLCADRGEDGAGQALRTFFDRYGAEGATLTDFEAAIGESAASDLTYFFREWFWGTASSEMLAQEMDEKDLAEQLAGRYKP